MTTSGIRWTSIGSRSVNADAAGGGGGVNADGNANANAAPNRAGGDDGGVAADRANRADPVSRAVRRPAAVLTDFDDTAAVQNVAELLLHRFGASDWPAVRQRFRDGELSLKEYQEITFLDIAASKSEMQNFVRANAEFRPGFADLCWFCRQNDIPLAIVSQGLDFYIQALLDGVGLPEVPVYAVATDFDDGGRIAGYRYDFAYPEAPERGNSKARIVRQFQAAGRYVFFMGDGRSDFEAAEVADAVLAHRQLAGMCDAAGVAWRPFGDFVGVLGVVREYVGG